MLSAFETFWTCRTCQTNIFVSVFIIWIILKILVRCQLLLVWGFDFGLGCCVLVCVGLALGCWIWGLRFGVWDFEFWVLGLGVVGFGCLGLVLHYFFGIWVTGFKLKILTAAYRGTISRVTGEPPGRSRGNHVDGSGGTGGPCDTYRYLFRTVRTPKASLVGEKSRYESSQSWHFLFDICKPKVRFGMSHPTPATKTT